MTNKYTITETIAWEVEGDSPKDALETFMNCDPMTQYGAFEWNIVERTITDPKTGETLDTGPITAQILDEEDTDLVINDGQAP